MHQTQRTNHMLLSVPAAPWHDAVPHAIPADSGMELLPTVVADHQNSSVHQLSLVTAAAKNISRKEMGRKKSPTRTPRGCRSNHSQDDDVMDIRPSAVHGEPATLRRVDSLHHLDFDLFPMKRLRGAHQKILDVYVFVLEFVSHLLYPLSIPFLLWIQGRVALVNKGFIRGKPVFPGQVIFTVIFLMPIVLYAANSGSSDWAVGPVIIGSAFTLFRMMIIAGKYASFKTSKYAQVVTSAEYNAVHDLLLATISVSDDVVEHMIKEAEIESGIHLSEMYFTLADGETAVSARVYMSALTRTAYQKLHPGNGGAQQLIRTGLGAVTALYPLAAFLTQSDDRSNAYTVVLLVAIMLQTFVYATIVFGFLGFAILYYARMNAIRQAYVGSLLFTGSAATVLKPADAACPVTGVTAAANTKAAIYVEDGEHAPILAAEEDDTDHADLAMIPASLPNNLIVWATVGNVIAHFSTTTNRRMSFNFVATLSVAIFLAAALVLQALRSGGTANLYLVLVISFLFGVKALAMLLSTWLAFSANRAELNVIKKVEEENFAFLWREAIRSRDAAAAIDRLGSEGPSSSLVSNELHHDGDLNVAEDAPVAETYMPFLSISDPKEHAEVFSRTVEIIRELISRRNEVEPLRVMYVAASMELVSFFASIAVSGGMLIVGLVFGGSPSSG